MNTQIEGLRAQAGCVGIDRDNASSAQLGLAGTVITADLRTIVNSIGQDAGFADWAAMGAWGAQPHDTDEEDQVTCRMLAAGALKPQRTTRSTARDRATPLRLIWSDQAGPAGLAISRGKHSTARA